MDGDRFDSCLRALANSRRTLMGGALVSMLGLTTLEDADARKKRKRKKTCKGGKVKCGKTCCAAGDVCQNAATGTCCPQARACGTVCCPATQVCGNAATSTCVAGTGTCAPCTGSCGTGNFTFCNANPLCLCATDTSGLTRCATTIPDIQLIDCGLCTTDADCAIRFPNVVGAFCAANATDPCSCAPGQNLCAAPCPTL